MFLYSDNSRDGAQIYFVNIGRELYQDMADILLVLDYPTLVLPAAAASASSTLVEKIVYFNIFKFKKTNTNTQYVKTWQVFQ